MDGNGVHEGLAAESLRCQLEVSELDLAHSEHQVKVLCQLLHGAKSEIACLVDEADRECHHLQSEVEKQQRELTALRAIGITTADAAVCETLPHSALETDLAACLCEVAGLRNAEEASWSRHAQLHEDVAATLAAIDQNVAGGAVYQWRSTEEARHRRLFASSTEAEAISAARAAEWRAATSETAARGLREASEQQLSQTLRAKSDAISRADACNTFASGLASELVSCEEQHRETQEILSRLASECSFAQLSCDRLEEEIWENKRSFSDLEHNLDTAQADHEHAKRRLNPHSRKLASQLGVQLEKSERELRGNHDQELGVERAACCAAREREQQVKVEAAAMGGARWSRLVHILELRMAKARADRCRAAWASGGRHRALVAPECACPQIIQDVERQCEHGARLLQSVEQLHQSQAEVIARKAQEASAEFLEAQVCWQAQVEQLRHEIQQARSGEQGEASAISNGTTDADCSSGDADCLEAASDCEWMYGDAGTGLLGFRALADLNPLRWSGSRTIPKGIEELRKVQQHGDRPIILKVPSGVRSNEVKLDSTEAAIHHLQVKLAASALTSSCQGEATSDQVDEAAMEAQLREEAAQASQLREELRAAQEAIGKLMAGADGGSGGLALGV
jgi:hypothetical protein